jgi:hypothetical protein
MTTAGADLKSSPSVRRGTDDLRDVAKPARCPGTRHQWWRLSLRCTDWPPRIWGRSCSCGITRTKRIRGLSGINAYIDKAGQRKGRNGSILTA